ncbi:MAG: thiamine phosphate synthase [Chlorobium sp.]|nr:MAG: thiamine phosphate synthase [Chlorobium sp.]
MRLNKLLPHPLPRIYLISSGEENADMDSRLMEQLRLLPRSIACMVQIREKQLDTQQLLKLALKARNTDLPEGTLLLVNKRIDVALEASLDGVHLPENTLKTADVHQNAPNLIAGFSVHSHESLRMAEASGADYLLYGPVFDTPSKRKYGPPQGLEKLAQLCRATTLPVFALGGITPDNALLCMDQGAYGIAALSIFGNTARLVETLEQFDQIISS